MENPNLDDRIFDDCWVQIFKQLSPMNRIHIERVSRNWKTLMPFSDTLPWLYFDNFIDQNGAIFKETSDSEDILIQILKGILNHAGSHLGLLDFELRNHECGFLLTKDLTEFIVQKAPNLVNLNLSSCAVTLGAISALTNLTKLEELRLRDVIYVLEEDLSSRVKDSEVIKSKIGSVIQNLPGMKKLRLSDAVKVTPMLLNRNLTELVIWDRETMTPADVRALVQQCPNLETLELYFTSPNPSDPHLGALGGLHKLKELIIWDVILTPADFDFICMGCPNLKTLNLTSIEGLTSCTELWRLRHLKTLYILGDSNSVFPNDSVLSSVVGHGVLEDVSLPLANLTDDGLKDLALNCPNLLKLNIKYIENISDEGVKAVLENCKKLEELVISGTSVGDPTMAAIGAHGSSLRWVDATETTVTQVGIKCLIEERQKRLSEGEGPLVPLEVSVDSELRPIFILNKEELATINLIDVHASRD